jgi:hypothetical protein
MQYGTNNNYVFDALAWAATFFHPDEFPCQSIHKLFAK